ncbi:major facilitator superfamily domain-containing protein [Apiospora rasikravindrae]|uniref:Major facilitator superfamily domain-containing protein n=1 Tax=Apiospora rasikravindrae TaxID=990691 RepID=A0ABR1SDA5_9PEZI
MDTVTPDAKLPAGVLAGPPSVAGVPASTGVPAEPLDLIEGPKVRTKLRLYAILSGLYLALFVAALDQTIVSIAIPTITSDLHSAQGYVWIGGAYLLANAATGPIWAKCSDIWGRKPLLLAAVALFTGASLLAALSNSMTMLIAGRALQGVASGGLMQLVTIVISDLFSVRKRSLYLGYVGFVWALAGSSGPLIGGAFTQFDWRWCFWINLPIGGLTFLLLVLFLDVHNPRTRIGEGVKAIDWIGTISILAVTLLLLLGLDFGGAIFPWNSPKVICLIVVGGLMIGFFVFSEQRLARYPLIPLTVFQNGSNNATFIVAFAHGMVLIGIEYYLPLFLQSVLQASPLRSGILMLPLIGTQAVVEILAGVVIHRTGRYQELIWAGAVLMTVGTGLYVTFGPGTSVAVVVGLEILGALGPALLFQGPMVSIQNTVSQDETASATACLGFIRNLAVSLSVVLGGVVFQNSMEARQSTLATAGLDPSVLTALSGSQAAANVVITQTTQDALQRHVVLEAFSWSLRNMFIMYTCLSGVALVASAFIKHRKLNEEHTETKTGIQSLAKSG